MKRLKRFKWALEVLVSSIVLVSCGRDERVVQNTVPTTQVETMSIEGEGGLTSSNETTKVHEGGLSSSNETVTAQEIDYWSFDMSSVYYEDTHADFKDMYNGLEVTGKTVGGLDIYHGDGYDYFIMNGVEKVQLNTNGKYAFFEEGTLQWTREGYLTPLIVKIGNAREVYVASQADSTERIEARLTATGLSPIMQHNGVIFNKQIITDVAGDIYVNLQELCNYLEFDMDILNDTIVCSKYGITITLNTSNFQVSLDSAVTREYAAEHDKEDISVKRLNVGAKTMRILEGVSSPYWIPVEYLQSVFGITYEYDERTNVVTLIDGLLLPRIVLLNTEELVNLYVISEESIGETTTTEEKETGKDSAEDRNEKETEKSMEEETSKTINSGWQLG